MTTQSTNHVLILLSDLDAIFARVCRTKFSKQDGWEATITDSFEDAKSKIIEQQPSLVLTDIMLSEGSGFDLLQFVRSSEGPLSSVPVVILTDLSQETDRERAMELGATEYLLKNEVSLVEVIDRLKHLLG